MADGNVNSAPDLRHSISQLLQVLDRCWNPSTFGSSLPDLYSLGADQHIKRIRLGDVFTKTWLVRDYTLTKIAVTIKERILHTK